MVAGAGVGRWVAIAVIAGLVVVQKVFTADGQDIDVACRGAVGFGDGTLG